MSVGGGWLIKKSGSSNRPGNRNSLPTPFAVLRTSVVAERLEVTLKQHDLVQRLLMYGIGSNTKAGMRLTGPKNGLDKRQSGSVPFLHLLRVEHISLWAHDYLGTRAKMDVAFGGKAVRSHLLLRRKALWLRDGGNECGSQSSG